MCFILTFEIPPNFLKMLLLHFQGSFSWLLLSYLLLATYYIQVVLCASPDDFFFFLF